MVENQRGDSLAVYDGMHRAGLCLRLPHYLKDAGKWSIGLWTTDGGYINLGVQKSRATAMRNFVVSYDRQWTYHQWTNGGWERMLFQNAFIKLSLDGYPGWEVDDNGSPWFVMFELIYLVEEGKHCRSRAMAIEFDDVARGIFYYRDWTSSGIPFLRKNETYWSGFWFQYKDDAVRFQETFGGFGTWMEGYKEFEQRCNEVR